MSNLNIDVLAKDVSEEKFFFREMATAEYKEEEIRLMIEVGSPDFIVQFRGKKYRVGVADLAEAICKEVMKDD